MNWVPLTVLAALLAACATAPDRFYTLNALPDSGSVARTAPILHVRLNVTVPSLVDRSEMVLDDAPNGIRIFDHERWAAPLSDQVAQTLAADIERRRGDVLIADARFDQRASPPVSVRVDIARMSAHRGGSGAVRLDAHWRIVDPAAGTDVIGADSFSAPLHGEDFSAVAQAYSAALGALADTLAAAVPTAAPPRARAAQLR